MNLRRLGNGAGWSSRSAVEDNSFEIDDALFFDLEIKFPFIVLPFCSRSFDVAKENQFPSATLILFIPMCFEP